MVKDCSLLKLYQRKSTDLSKVSFGSCGIKIICDLYRSSAAVVVGLTDGQASRRNLLAWIPYCPAEQEFIPRS
jgi:hypothetical protein